MRRLLSSIIGTLAMVVLSRWGFGISTPSRDMRQMRRAVGWCERMATRLDALVVRMGVILSDVFGIDRLRWRLLRRRFLAGDFLGDTAYGDNAE